MALLVKENSLCMVDNEQAVDPNIVVVKLVTRRWLDERWYVVGCYFALSDWKRGKSEHERRSEGAADENAATFVK